MPTKGVFASGNFIGRDIFHLSLKCRSSYVVFHSSINNALNLSVVEKLHKKSVISVNLLIVFLLIQSIVDREPTQRRVTKKLFILIQ